MPKSPLATLNGWPLYAFLTIFFWGLPIIFVSISWEMIFVFFSAAVGTKWFVFASLDFIQKHPDKSLTIHQFLNRG